MKKTKKLYYVYANFFYILFFSKNYYGNTYRSKQMQSMSANLELHLKQGFSFEYINSWKYNSIYTVKEITKECSNNYIDEKKLKSVWKKKFYY